MKPEAVDWQKKYPLSCSEGIDTQFYAGWNRIVCDMFDKIEFVLKDMYNLEHERSQERENRFWVGQIKEKFAGLRVYADIPSFWKTEYQKECDLIQEVDCIPSAYSILSLLPGEPAYPTDQFGTDDEESLQTH